MGKVMGFVRAFVLALGLCAALVTGAAAADRREIANHPAELVSLMTDPRPAWTVRGVEIEAFGTADLDVSEVEVFDPAARIIVNAGSGERDAPRPPTRFMRGGIRGMHGSVVAITITDDGGISGLITDGAITWQLRRRGSDAALEAATVDASRGGPRSPFQCGNDTLVEPPELAASRLLMGSPPPSEPLPVGQLYKVTLAIETDHEFYQLMGSSASAASNYVGSLFNYVGALYELESQTRLTVGDVFLWTTAADPWTQSGGTSPQLTEFRNYWTSNRAGVSRTLAHFLSGRALGGGIAYLDTLCNSSFGYGLSANLNGTIQTPSGIAWDAVVVAHELGHNFSSPHTHCYGGIGGTANPVDACWNQEGGAGCWSGPTSLPGAGGLTGGTSGSRNGTIMSYCHQIAGGIGNISGTFGFGFNHGVQPDRVPTRMFNRVAAVAAGNPACIPVVTDGAATVQFGAATYNVGEGAGSVSVAITRSGTIGTASVNYATASGTATSGTDFTATSGTANFAAGVSTVNISVPITNDSAVEGNETFTVTLSNPSGATLGSPSSTTVTIVDNDTAGGIPLGQALDNTALIWTTGGNSSWSGQTAVWYFGGSAAASGTIGNSQKSWVQTTVTGPGTLSFRWRVSSQQNSDHLSFYADGSLRDRISGERGWQQTDWIISAGVFTLRWEYAKDGAGASGADTGWLDQVTFTPTVPRTLTVSKSGTGSGTVTSAPAGIDCGSTCSAGFDAGSSVTLTAAADAGSAFGGWSGGGCSGTGACTVTMSAATTVTAAFDFVADTTPDPFGFPPKTGVLPGVTVVSDAVRPTGYDFRTPVSITHGEYSIGCMGSFTSAPGFINPGWSVCVRHTAASTSSTAVTTTLTVGGVAGSFVSTTAAPAGLALAVDKAGTGLGTVRSAPAGINCGSTCSAGFAPGTSVTLTATPAVSSTFTGWSGACSGTGTCTVSLTQARSVTAGFSFTPKTAEKAAALYVGFFFRAPDEAGLTFWKGYALASSLTDMALMKHVAAGFAMHPSFTSIYGGLNNEAYVDAIYLNVGGKPADAAGKAYWLGRLATDLSRSDFVAEFLYYLLELTEQQLQEMYDRGQITLAELQDALARKARMANKTEVSRAFVTALGPATNLLPGTNPNDPVSLEQDPTYRASKNIIRSVTEDPVTKVPPLDYLAGSPSIEGINQLFGP